MRILFTLMALFVVASSFAQINVTGKVVSNSNEPLPGATILLDGTTLGTISDFNGEFQLSNLKAGKTALRISFIGYKDHLEIVDLKSDLKLAVQLEENAVLTEAVFVYATRASSNTPIATSNMAKEQIEDRNMGQDIPYLLSTTPSFVASSDAGAGIGYTNFRIRGTDANRINVTVNGVPLNDAESHGVWWVNMPDFSSSVENLQVQRGVGTSTHGAAAFGATINMQTNALRDKAYAEYSGAGGSFNSLKNTVRIGSGLISDHFSFDARLSKISSEGYIDRASTNLKSFFVSGGYFAENTILKLNIFSGLEKTYQAWSGIPSEILAEGNRTYNPYTYENETDNYQQDHYQLLFSHQYGEFINFNAALHYTYGRGYYEQFKEDEDFADYGLENISLGDDELETSNIIRQKWLDNNFYGGTFSVNYLKDQSDISFGAGWNKYDGSHFGNIIWAQYASNGAKDYEWYRSMGNKTDFNIFTKYNYELTKEINLYADVQYRNILYSIDGIDDDLRDLTQDHSFDFFNPKLGVFYQPTSKLKLYASWAVANREPSRSNFVDADPNGPQPTPEKLNDFEIGYNYQTSTFSLGANAYYMLYKDQLILTGEINDVGSAIMTNVDDSYRAGIEIMGGVQLLSNLNWDVNATFSENRIANFTEYVDNWDTWGQETYELGTTDIAFSPQFIANSMLNFTPIENLTLSLISQYVGQQYIDNSSSEDRKIDAYFVNNLKASYTIYPKFAKEVEFSLLINNLLNEEYETNAWVYSYVYGNERYKMDGYFPQAGTNFLFGVNIKF